MTKYRFDQIAANSTAKKKPEDSDREHYIGLEHLDPGTLEVTRWGAEVTPKGDKLVMEKGDVLFGRRRAYQKKVGVAPFDGIFSAHGMVLRPKADVVDRFFFPFFISSDAFLDEAIRISVGSLSPTANWKDLKVLEFDLPSMERQREIAGILSEAERLKGHYRNLLMACDDVVKSQFVEMFGGPEVFEAAPNTVKDVAKLRVGIVIKPSRFYAATGTGTPAFRSLNIGPMRVQNSDWIEFTDEAMRVNMRTVAHEGDVLIVRSGYPGTSCVVTAEFAGRNVVDLIIATPDRDKILPEYLCAYLNCPPGKSQIERMQHGVAQQHFNVGMCEKLRLRIPPLSHQKEFADFAAQVDKSKFAVQKALDELNATTKKILNQELGLGDV